MNKREWRLKRISRSKSKFWTLEGKTIWDVLQLLVIPIALAIIAIIFSYIQSKENYRIEADRTRQSILDDYFDKINTLVLEEKLSASSTENDALQFVRGYTLSTLRTLDSERKGLLLKFLYESNLIGSCFFPRSDKYLNFLFAKNEPALISLAKTDLRYVNLHNVYLGCANMADSVLIRANLQNSNLYYVILDRADLTEADLGGADLHGASLRRAKMNGADFNKAQLYLAELLGADLTGADLRNVNLINADLSLADLSRTNLTGANLTGADLSGACLWKATVSKDQLNAAKTLKGAVLPDGDLEKCYKN